MNKFADAYNLLKTAELKPHREFTVHEFSGDTITFGNVEGKTRVTVPLRYLNVGISFLDRTEEDLFSEMRELESAFYDIAAEGAEKVYVFSPTAGLWHVRDQTMNVAYALVSEYKDGSYAVFEGGKMRRL